MTKTRQGLQLKDIDRSSDSLSYSPRTPWQIGQRTVDICRGSSCSITGKDSAIKAAAVSPSKIRCHWSLVKSIFVFIAANS